MIENTQMDFSTALRSLKNGERIRRNAWEEGHYIFTIYRSNDIFYSDGNLSSSWIATNYDIMANDWVKWWSE